MTFIEVVKKKKEVGGGETEKYSYAIGWKKEPPMPEMDRKW